MKRKLRLNLSPQEGGQQIRNRLAHDGEQNRPSSTRLDGEQSPTLLCEHLISSFLRQILYMSCSFYLPKSPLTPKRMKQKTVLLLLIALTCKTQASRPNIFVNSSEYPALQAQSANEPWASMKSKALYDATNTVIDTAGTYKERSIQLSKVMSSNALAYILDPVNSSTYKSAIVSAFEYWDKGTPSNIRDELNMTQGSSTGQWHQIGETFSMDTTDFVMLLNTEANGYVIFDAVKFEKLNQ